MRTYTGTHTKCHLRVIVKQTNSLELAVGSSPARLQNKSSIDEESHGIPPHKIYFTGKKNKKSKARLSSLLSFDSGIL